MSIIQQITTSVFKWILFLGAMAITHNSMAQDPTDLRTHLYGNVNSQDIKGGLGGAQIVVFKNGSKSQTLSTDDRGKFDFFLEPGAVYKLEFIFSDHVTKRMEVDTRSVTPEAEWGGQFKFDMELFKHRDGLNVSILNKPIAKLFYSPELGDMDFDKAYTASIKAEIERLQEELDAKLKAEEAEKRELEAAYTKAIATADKAMGSKDYLKAKQEYTRALSYKPDEDYPQKKLEEAQKLYDADQAAKNVEKDYKEAIESAEFALYEKDYKKAESEFDRALSIKPGDKYAKDQLKELRDRMMNVAKAEQDYVAAIQKADAALASKDYLTAKGEYQKATEAKPDEQYPKDQLEQVNALIKQDADKEKNYIQAIGRGDNAMEIKDYESAKAAFQQASEIKPEEKYPKSQVVEIDRILAELAALNKSYNDAIKTADDAFAANKFDVAKQSYEKASQLKPEEQYPKDQLKAIETKQIELANLEAKYKEIIKEADSRYDIQEFVAAKAEYAKALELKPTEEYPKKRLAEVTEKLEKMAKQDADYTAAIQNGDNAFKAKDYLSAKVEYESASKIKPNEQYPKDQLALVMNELAAAEKKEADYETAIKNGDAAFTAADYAKAKTEYETALSLKPEEKYPKEKISEIEGKLVEIENANKLYQDMIASADKAFEAKDFDMAKKDYESAASMKPTEQYPKDKLNEISELVAAAEKQDADYNAAIEAGDKAFEAKDYANSKTQYQNALGIKPGEKHPADRIAEIEGLLAEQEKLNQQYNELIATADAAFTNDEMENARTSYEKALQIKPDESHPKNRIAEIEGKLADAAKAEQDYLAAIERAEKAEKAKDYPTAKSEFETASGIKPGEQYPKDKIAEISALLQGQQKLEADYTEAIKLADDAFNNKEYDIAKTSYEKASNLKPDESYPKEKIAAIAKIKEDEAKAIELANAAQQKYDELIASADGSFQSSEFEKARKDYQAALEVKPEEAYPKDQLKKIDDKILELEAQADAEAALKAKQEKYDGIIAEADKMFESKDYDAAITKYEEAQAVLPEETYPADQLTKINQIKTDEAQAIALANKANEEKYQTLITTADNAMKSSDYDSAEKDYRSALEVKPEEAYPKDQISKIATLRSEGEAKEKEYANFISSADKAFNSTEYEAARKDYQSALAIKPGEQYPTDQLAEIDRLVSEAAAQAELAEKEAAEKEKNEKYNNLIASADKSFKSGTYDAAKTDYQAALEVKPGEQYPTDQMAEIDRLVSEAAAQAELAEKEAAEKEKDEKYNSLIASADKSFKSGTYDAAKADYQAALEVKPGEQYPTDQMAEIDRLVSEAAAQAELAKKAAAEKEIEEKYNGFIAAADKGFKSGDYELARNNYQSALGVKEGEQYPIDQLAEIDRLVKESEALADKERLEAEAAEREKQYKNLISSADKNFKSKKLEPAKADYQAALKIKPEEQYPADQIAEIDKVMSAEIALAKSEQQYQEFITRADTEFDNKNFNGAKSSYQKALDIKPEEQYPKDRLAAIDIELAKIAENDQLEAEKRAKDEARYNELITLADKSFGNESYEKATAHYKSALELKPGEKYPQDQINEISSRIAKQMENEEAARERKEMLARYDAQILKGDKALAAKKYKDANDAYRGALTIMPNEQYPKDKLKEIDAILNKPKEVAVVPQEKPRAKISGKSDDDIAAMIAEMKRKREQAKADQLIQAQQDWTGAQGDRISGSHTRRENAGADLALLQDGLASDDAARKEVYGGRVEKLEVFTEQVTETRKNNIDKADDRRNNANADLEQQQKDIYTTNVEGNKLHEFGAERVATFKIEYELQERDRISESENKRNDKNNEIAEYSEATKYRSDHGEETRLKSTEKLVTFEKELSEVQNDRIKTADERRAGNFQKKLDMQNELVQQHQEGNQQHQKHAQTLESNQQKHNEYMVERSKTADQRRDNNLQEINDYSEQVAKNVDEKYNHYVANNQKIQERNESITSYQRELVRSADERRENYDVDYYQGENKPRKSADAGKYPQGVTEETYEEGNSIIVKRFVVEGESLDEYEKIYYTWGGVFFKKNGQDITEEIWEAETE